MATELVVNGREQHFPGNISSLEELLNYAQRREAGMNIIVEVEVDGETFSEAYPHEAQALDLKDIERVSVISVSGDQFARDFILQAPEFVSHIKTGFSSAATLLKTPGNEPDGHDIMGRSLDVLRAFRSHCDLVERTTSSGMTVEFKELWNRLAPVAEALVDAQAASDPVEIAGLLDTTMVPFLDSLHKTLQ